jgi:hypothetical protein
MEIVMIRVYHGGVVRYGAITAGSYDTRSLIHRPAIVVTCI